MNEGVYSHKDTFAPREFVQISPNRLLLAYLNTRQIRIADAAVTLKMDPNELRALCLSKDTTLQQSKLIAKLSRHG